MEGGSRQPIAHGPGPPHRPHIGGTSVVPFDGPSDATANTDSTRAVCSDPHSGHFTASVELIDRTNFSNFAPQGLHWYS